MDTVSKDQECALRALRLSRVWPECGSTTCDESLECPACAAKGHQSKLARLPAALPLPFRFNETTWWMDLFLRAESPDSSQNVVFCNMVCWNTMVYRHCSIPDPGQKTVPRDCGEVRIRTTGSQYFGPPLLVFTDQVKGVLRGHPVQRLTHEMQTASCFTQLT